MGNFIFQPPAGLSWEIKKRPRYSSLTTNTFSGKGQVRLAKQIFPIWEYEMNWDYLTGSEQSAIGANAGLQQLMGFFMARQGSFDSFLFSDPNDNSVTAEQFGMGDGTSTAFQLSRFIGGGFDIVQNVNQSVTPIKIYKNGWQGSKNLLIFSEDLTSAAWQAGGTNGVTRTVNAAFAPDGSNNAAKLAFGATGASQFFNWWQGTGMLAVSGDVYTFSVWVRADVPSVIAQTIRLGTGSEQTIGISVTAQWQRFVTTGTVGLLPTGNVSAGFYNTSSQPAATIYAWGAQLERGSSATSYQKTSANTWGPVLQSSSARTNICLQSQTFDNASWSKQQVTITADAISAPDGTTSADKMLDSVTNAEHYIEQTFSSVANNQTIACSIFLKQAELSWVAVSIVQKDGSTANGWYVNLSTGTIGSSFGSFPPTISVTRNVGGWWYVSIVGSAGSGASAARFRIKETTGNNVASYAGTGLQGIYGWGAQVELSSVTTSYIATTSAAVTVTDYSLGTTGIVTFASAPANNALLTWDGSYYYRLHFADDINEFNNFMNQLWELQSVKFESVILSDNSTAG